MIVIVVVIEGDVLRKETIVEKHQLKIYPAEKEATPNVPRFHSVAENKNVV